MKNTAKQIAKDFIRPLVLRGDSLDSLANYMGCFCSDFGVQIGGYAVLTHGLDYEEKDKWTSTKLNRYQIAVTEIQGKECLHIFNLKELYNEIKKGEQLALF